MYIYYIYNIYKLKIKHFCSEITPEYKYRFEKKENQLRSLIEINSNDSILIGINRNDLFNDAYEEIMSKSPHELKKRLAIVYGNENGIDAGGILRYCIIIIIILFYFIFHIFQMYIYLYII